MDFHIGDSVELATNDPRYGLGEAKLGQEGIVTSVDQHPYIVDFPTHKGFLATGSDLKLADTGLQKPKHPTTIKIRLVKGEPPDSLEKKMSVPPPHPAPSDKTQAIFKQWKLNKALKLETLAADFYTLIDLQCDYPDEPKVNEPLAELTTLLADQFSAYLDMVIGGELRHTWENTIDPNRGYDDEQYESIDDMPISQMAQGILKGFIPYGSFKGRDFVWREWQAIRKKLGIDALKAATSIFHLKWDDGYGGESWARATEVLIEYLTGGLSATAFVDTCFGLHHNNNIILDKVWTIKVELKKVLDYNLHNKLGEVTQYCSPQVTKLRRRLHK